MQHYFKLVFKILFFKESPENVPYSLSLLGLSFIIYFALLLLSYPQNISFVKPIGFILFWLGYTFYILKIKKMQNRFVQTMSTLFLVSSMIQVAKILIIQLAWLLMSLFLTPGFSSLSAKLIFIPMTLTGLVYLWELLAISFIYKQALGIKNYLALLITLTLVIVAALIFYAVN